MIRDGLRLQVWGIPNDVTLPRPLVPDQWMERAAEFRESSDYGVENHRRRDTLDADEPAARRDTWDGTMLEHPWLV